MRLTDRWLACQPSGVARDGVGLFRAHDGARSCWGAIVALFRTFTLPAALWACGPSFFCAAKQLQKCACLLHVIITLALMEDRVAS